MRLRNLTSMTPTGASVCAVLGLASWATGCGPSGPGSLEGFGSLGETHGDGDGDGDPTGDGDGDPAGGCIDVELGAQSEVFTEGLIDPAASDDHPFVCSGGLGPDASYSWIAPFSSTYQLIVESELPVSAEVLRGRCAGTGEACGSFDFFHVLEFEALEGQEYTFIVDADDAEGGFHYLSLYPIDPVPNDCPDGELIGELPLSLFGTTQGASNQFGSPCGGEGAPERSYVFVPPFSGVYTVDTLGSNYDTMLYVLPEVCGGPSLVCNDDEFETTQSYVEAQLDAGFAYTIVVDGYGGEAGDFQLNINMLDSPNICDGIDALAPQTPTSTQWGTEFDEGDVYAQCSFLPNERRHRWIAPDDGLYRATLTSTTNPTALSVIPDGCAWPDVPPGPCEVNPELGGPVTIEFEAGAGQEFLLVSEWDQFELDQFDLVIEQVFEPGTGCGIDLDSTLPVLEQGTTLGANDDHAGSCTVGDSPDVEYGWTPPATGSYRISLEGSNYDSLLFVRAGGCEGEEIACVDDTIIGDMAVLWASVELELNEGQTISIFVDGYSGAGEYQLAIDML